MQAYVIPVEGPMQVLELPDQGSGYELIKAALGGGWLEAVPFRPDARVSCYVDEEGKLKGLPINRRATDMMIGSISYGDYIAGPMIVTGFDPSTGDTIDLPQLPHKMRLVLKEAAL